MELKQLQSLMAVATYRSFSKAAEVLYLSQPTVSTHIRQLEDELNIRLILRTTKSVELTPKGREVCVYARSILQLHRRMLDCCTRADEQTIHVGASTIPATYLLPGILSQYEKAHPRVSFRIHQSDSQGVIDGLQDDLFDVGLVGMPCEGENLACVPFYRDRMVLIAPNTPRFAALQGQANPVPLLLRQPIILREKGSGSKRCADALLEQMGVEPSALHVTARVNDQETIKNLVAGGLGVSILSEMAARNFVQQQRVLQFEFSGIDSGRTLYLVYHDRYVLRKSVQSFIKFVTQQFQSGAAAPPG